MSETTEKKSPWSDVEPKENGAASKELWSKPKEIRRKAKELKKSKQVHTSNLDQKFDA